MLTAGDRRGSASAAAFALAWLAQVRSQLQSGLPQQTFSVTGLRPPRGILTGTLQL